jgi:2,3-bisphosphoglycerate-dependent phosphoglycerate mutase
LANPIPPSTSDAAPLSESEPRPLTLILIRHGETADNAIGRLQGQRDVPLSDIGRAQAERLAARLLAAYSATSSLLPGPPDAVFTSDLSRASETAQIACRNLGFLSLPAPIELRELRERGFGDWEGLDSAGVRARRAAGEIDPPNGETDEMVWQRMLQGLDRIARAARESEKPFVAMVFGHGGSLRMLIRRALNAPLEIVRHLQLSNTGITLLRFADAAQIETTEGRVLCMNDTAHLQ